MKTHKLIPTLLLPLMFVFGCSSSPTSSESSEDNLPKAASRKKIEDKVLITAPPVAAPVVESSEEKQGCITPLGKMAHGSKLTGYLEAEVGPQETCISDTISCHNGQWKGDAIYKKCVKRLK